MRTILDTTEVSNPNGVRELSQELFYDDELKCVFNRVDGDLEFHNDGYDYIEDILFTQGLCSQIELSLIIENREYFEGIIHIVDITEWNATRETIKTPIADNNLSSYVFNNRNVKAYINAPKTKSGGTATPASNIVNFDLFTPVGGAYGVLRDNVYRVDEAFSFLVDFISDGQMTYTSPFFGTGGDRENLMIASALHLSTDSDVHPYLSFYELFTEMDKLFNLSMYIDYSTATPQIVIDKTDNIYVSTNLITLTDVRDITMSFDREKMYAFIDMGSSQYQEYNLGTFTYPDANFLGFKEERYYIIGQCNLDRGLNLVNDFIIDSNAIEDMVSNKNDAFDETVVIIESDDGLVAKQYDNILGNTGKVYNLGLTNYEKSVNYLGAIPNDMVKYISNDANNFEAEKNTAYALTTGVIVHPTVVTDPGGNYNNVTGRFTCPIGAEGAFSFSFAYTGLSYTGTLGANAGNIKLRHYSAGAVLLNEITILDFTHEIVVFGFGGGTGVFAMNAGDYVELYGTAGLIATTVFGTTQFNGQYIDVEGGTFQTYNPNDYKVFNIEFNVPLTMAQYVNIRNNITNTITVQGGGKTFVGWVKNIKRNILNGMAKITLRTSNSKIQTRNVTR